MAANLNLVNLQLEVVELGIQFTEYLEILALKKKNLGDGGLYDEEEFIIFTRMNVQTFEYLHELIRHMLIKRSRRPHLPPELRLALTINYLAHADSIQKTKWFYSIGESTIKQIIPEVCNVLSETLAPLFLRYPSREQFQVISNDFLVNLSFPNCVGAVDGRHCAIQKPPNSGSLFFNYKKYFSIVLMAACDSQKRFIWASIGDYGSLNDAGIFANNDLGHALSQNEVQLPPPMPLPNTQTLCPHYFIGDGIFPLKNYMLKPFMRNDNLTMVHTAFNYRLSFARRIIECAFGELALMWLVHQSKLQWKLGTTERIIMSTLCLHNMLLDFKYNEVGNRWTNFFNGYQVAENNGPPMVEENMQQFRVRDQLCQYFISPQGSVPWQWEKM